MHLRRPVSTEGTGTAKAQGGRISVRLRRLGRPKEAREGKGYCSNVSEAPEGILKIRETQLVSNDWPFFLFLTKWEVAEEC